MFLHPECGDDPTTYETIPVVHPLTGEPGLMLKRGADGLSCGYLEKGKGCTIYDRRPAMCREFDCRGAYLRLLELSRNERRALSKPLGRKVTQRGRELLGNQALRLKRVAV